MWMILRSPGSLCKSSRDEGILSLPDAPGSTLPTNHLCVFVRTTTVQSWAKGQEAQACWEWSPGPIHEGRVNKRVGLQAMGEDGRQGSSQAGRKDWAPLQFVETSGMVHVQNSTRTRCLGWERGLKGWGKREFLSWMGTRPAFSVFVGIADALAQGDLSLGSHWARG